MMKFSRGEDVEREEQGGENLGELEEGVDKDERASA